MANEINSVIITSMDSNYEKNLLKDFLYTLFNFASYKGKVIVLDYGMSSSTINNIQKDYGVKIVKCSKDGRQIFSVRNRDIVSVIQELPEDITHVMAVDSGDVWFQAPINELFELCDTKIGYVESYYYMSSDLWAKKFLKILGPHEMNKLLYNFRATKLKNAGMMCGPKDLICCVANAINELTVKAGMDYFGLDQVYFNYIINKLDSNLKLVLPKKYNYVLVDNKKTLIIKDEKIYDNENVLVNVVHNAGGAYGRVIKKEVGSSFDYLQYRRIRQIHTVN